jgi:hypothetical protein
VCNTFITEVPEGEKNTWRTNVQNCPNLIKTINLHFQEVQWMQVIRSEEIFTKVYDNHHNKMA